MLRPSDSVLARFTRDLTADARLGRLDVVYGREPELDRLTDILLRRDKNNPVLVGEAGVGKTAIAEGLAQRLAARSVPLSLRGHRLLALDHTAMLGGTMYRGQYEQRMQRLIAEVVSAGDVILFVDELHNLMGQGTALGVAMDAANMLKPPLTRREFRVLGATTSSEYERWLRPDPALERRFQPVQVRELTAEEATAVLKARRTVLERHHLVVITDSAIQAAVRLTDLFQPERRRPDRALDALDEACAHIHARASYSEAAERLIEQLNQGQASAGNPAAESVDGPGDDPLLRFAREGAAALGRLGAELDAAFGVVGDGEGAVEAHPSRGTGRASSALDVQRSTVLSVALRELLFQADIVVSGQDVARVVGLITGKNVKWSE